MKQFIGAVRRLPLTATVPILIFAVFGIFGAWIAPHDPTAIDLGGALQSPSAEHWFGTDDLGRDVLSRLITASGTTLLAIVVVLSVALTVGIVVGGVAGAVGGWFDDAVMRLVDVWLSLPSLVLALAVIGIRGPGYGNMMLALGLAWWPAYARLSRAVVISTKQQAYIEAVRLQGAHPARIFVRHLLPRSVGPVLVYASADAGAIALAVATLSFLGLGPLPPTPEWGQMLVDGLPYLEREPRLVILPGLALTAAIIAYNLLGEAIALRFVPRALKGQTLRRRQRLTTAEDAVSEKVEKARMEVGA